MRSDSRAWFVWTLRQLKNAYLGRPVLTIGAHSRRCLVDGLARAERFAFPVLFRFAHALIFLELFTPAPKLNNNLL